MLMNKYSLNVAVIFFSICSLGLLALRWLSEWARMEKFGLPHILVRNRFREDYAVP